MPPASTRTTLALLVLLFLPAVAVPQAVPRAHPPDWSSVVTAMGRPGKSQPNGVYKFAMPRKDLKVTVAGTPITAGLALGSWVAFNGSGPHTMVMGDLVLTEDEVAPVMLKLEQSGLNLTALHNHLLYETPRVMYMHIEGNGDATKLATAIHNALALTRTPLPDAAPTQQQPMPLDTAQLESVLGHKGTVDDGVFHVAVPRTELIRDGGMVVPPSMGTATSFNFQPTGGEKAAIAGDFVLRPDEVNPVIKALRDHGIEVTAIHNHMLHDQPRLIFLHFWANDDALKLAYGLRAALDYTNSAPPIQNQVNTPLVTPPAL